jgi:hypothetical protein
VSPPLEIGFSQRIRLPWLEAAASLARAGYVRAEARRALQDLLSDQVSVGSEAERSNREKVITILLRTWIAVPQGVQALRDEGLEFRQLLSADQHLAVHWGMVMAAYPFFARVAESTGRLLRLRGTLAAGQIQRRLREELGERETVARAARRVLRSFHDWQVLEESGHRGVYRPARAHAISDSRLAAWLLEATLIAARSPSLPLLALLQSPALFPFSLPVLKAAEFSDRGRLSVYRQGLDQDVVAIAGSVRK